MDNSPAAGRIGNTPLSCSRPEKYQDAKPAERRQLPALASQRRWNQPGLTALLWLLPTIPMDRGRGDYKRHSRRVIGPAKCAVVAAKRNATGSAAVGTERERRSLPPQPDFVRRASLHGLAVCHFPPRHKLYRRTKLRKRRWIGYEDIQKVPTRTYFLGIETAVPTAAATVTLRLGLSTGPWEDAAKAVFDAAGGRSAPDHGATFSIR